MKNQLMASTMMIASLAASADQIPMHLMSPHTAIALHNVSSLALRSEQHAAPMLMAAADSDTSSKQQSAASGKTHSVVTQVTKFSPMVLFVQPGDTVTWTNMAGHDTATIEGMIPDGATAWQSKMGETYSHTFTQEGAYLYKCNPHVSMGMIGAVIVGSHDPANMASIEGHPENKGMVGRAVRMVKKELAK